MKKTGTMVFVAIVVIAAVGGYWYVTSDEAGNFWTEAWDTIGDFNLSGEWRITPYAITDSGERIFLKDGAESLWVMHDLIHVQSVEYVVEGQATRNIAPGVFTSVEVDSTELTMGMETWATFDIPGPHMHFTETGLGTTTLYFTGDDTTTPWTEIASYIVPTDIEDCELSVCGPWTSLTTMTDGWQSGLWNFKFYCDGQITFQGKNSETGDGDILNAALPGSVLTVVVIGQYTANIDWNTNVTYNP